MSFASLIIYLSNGAGNIRKKRHCRSLKKKNIYILTGISSSFYRNAFRRKWWRDATLPDRPARPVVIGSRCRRSLAGRQQRRSSAVFSVSFFFSSRLCACVWCSSAWREDEAVQVQTARWRLHHSRPISRLSSIITGAPCHRRLLFAAFRQVLSVSKVCLIQQQIDRLPPLGFFFFSFCLHPTNFHRPKWTSRASASHYFNVLIVFKTLWRDSAPPNLPSCSRPTQFITGGLKQYSLTCVSDRFVFATSGASVRIVLCGISDRRTKRNKKKGETKNSNPFPFWQFLPLDYWERREKLDPDLFCARVCVCVDVLKSSPQRRRKKKREIFVFFVFFCFRFLRDWKRRRNAPTDSRHEEMNWPTSSPSLLVVLPASRKRTINNCTWTFVILLAVFTHLAGKSLLTGAFLLAVAGGGGRH